MEESSHQGRIERNNSLRQSETISGKNTGFAASKKSSYGAYNNKNIISVYNPTGLQTSNVSNSINPR